MMNKGYKFVHIIMLKLFEGKNVKRKTYNHDKIMIKRFVTMYIHNFIK